jgi:hypothetical protein
LKAWTLKLELESVNFLKLRLESADFEAKA